MQTMTAIIADDEQPLRIYLRKLLNEIWPELLICAEAQNGQEALALICQHKPDVVFLDIHMPGMSGIEIAEKMAEMALSQQTGHSCQIVFITAFDQYAVDAFEKQAIDYILKPVKKSRLLKTIERIQSRKMELSQISGEMIQVLTTIFPKKAFFSEPKYLDWIRAMHGNKIRIIAIGKVVYFKTSGRYTAVISNQGESLIHRPIKELIAELNPNHFWQINRATIINVSAIDEVSRSLSGKYIVKMKHTHDLLTVSRNYIHLFKHM